MICARGGTKTLFDRSTVRYDHSVRPRTHLQRHMFMPPWTRSRSSLPSVSWTRDQAQKCPSRAASLHNQMHRHDARRIENALHGPWSNATSAGAVFDMAQAVCFADLSNQSRDPQSRLQVIFRMCRRNSIRRALLIGLDYTQKGDVEGRTE